MDTSYYPPQYDPQTLQPAPGQDPRQDQSLALDTFATQSQQLQPQQHLYNQPNHVQGSLQDLGDPNDDVQMGDLSHMKNTSTSTSMPHLGMMQSYNVPNNFSPDFDFVPASTINHNMLVAPGQGLHLPTTFGNIQDPYTMSSPSSNFPLQGSPIMDMQDTYMSSNMAMSMDFSNNNFNDLDTSAMNYMQMQQGQHGDFPDNHVSPMLQYRQQPALQQQQQQPSVQFNAQDLKDFQGGSLGMQQSGRRQSLQTDGTVVGSLTHEASNSSDPSRRHSVTIPPTQFTLQQPPQKNQSKQLQSQAQLRKQMQEVQSQGMLIQQSPNFNWAMSQPESQLVLQPGQNPYRNTYRNAYSATGFDMLSILTKVVSRKNPEIKLGPVDLSCAFVVCDASEHDIPIVYCSENFERLTGYTKHEILGRNCRFLQAPDGKVQAGVKRRYVDDESIWYLKKTVEEKKESQVSIINYRKGGQPFMNLLTMIPICDDNDRLQYFVGFQVDLVEQPNSVTSKNPDGTFAINYQRGLNMPSYHFNGNNSAQPKLESGQTISRDDVSAVLATVANGGSDLSKGMWDKMLLENTDDVIFVLSLKGLFLYMSPACNRVFEYEASELLQTPLSSVCHPSDIISITRELKDTTPNGSVDVVFRIRRKERGYMWFEARGSLHTEQGKGRKSIILVGRERPVYTLSTLDISAEGGIGENEIWSKLSTSGMFLFVANNVRQLLDRTPDELTGTSMQALMRPDSKLDFSRILGIVKTGKRASVKHDIMNKRGNVLHAYSTLYPGDATEGQKPTFVIAQTRLIKYTKPSGSRSHFAAPRLLHLGSSMSLDGGNATPMSTGSTAFTFTAPSNAADEKANDPGRYMSTFESAATFSGQHGLSLGHQDVALASDTNLFDELKTTRTSSWQFELRQMEKKNRLLAEELQALLAARKKRKRRKHGAPEKDCANCHTKQTPEWRRGPSGARDLCNSCGLRYAKQQGRISPRTHKTNSNASGGDGVSPQQAHSTVGDAGQGTSPNLLHQQSRSSTQSKKSLGQNSQNQPSIAGTLADADGYQQQAGTSRRRSGPTSRPPSLSTAPSGEYEGSREQADDVDESHKARRLQPRDGQPPPSPSQSRRMSITWQGEDMWQVASDDEGDADGDSDQASGDADGDDEGEAGPPTTEALSSSHRRSGNPNVGSELPNMIEENVAGEKEAMDAENDALS